VPQPLEPEARITSKVSNVLAIEVSTNFLFTFKCLHLYLQRPVWNESPPTASSASGNSIIAAPVNGAEMSQESSSSSSHSVVVHNLGSPTWPAATDLIFLPGSNKVMLTVQRPLIRMVIQDAIERTRATMMFTDAFPDVFDALKFIKDALILAAELKENATDVHDRLNSDHEYTINMSRLVST